MTKTIGIVNGIAAPTRFQLLLMVMRITLVQRQCINDQDALVASAGITDINRAACTESVYGTVGTVGKLNVIPNSHERHSRASKIFG